MMNIDESVEKKVSKPVVVSPPWYIIWEKINAALGVDKSLEIKPMYSEEKDDEIIWMMDIIANSYIKARALAGILNNEYDYGNNLVKVNVYFNDKIVLAPEFPHGIPVKYVVKVIIERALRDNPLFDSVLDKGMFDKDIQVEKIDALDADLALVFKKEVIQFYADDLNDLFLNYNIVAADVFEDILKSEMFGEKLTFTTEADAVIRYMEE